MREAMEEVYREYPEFPGVKFRPHTAGQSLPMPAPAIPAGAPNPIRRRPMALPEKLSPVMREILLNLASCPILMRRRRRKRVPLRIRRFRRKECHPI